MTSSTKIAIVTIATALLLSACSHRTDGGWRNDCDANYSFDSRENAMCKERKSTGAATQSPVKSDSEDASRPGEGSRETEKGRN